MYLCIYLYINTSGQHLWPPNALVERPELRRCGHVAAAAAARRGAAQSVEGSRRLWGRASGGRWSARRSAAPISIGPAPQTLSPALAGAARRGRGLRRTGRPRAWGEYGQADQDSVARPRRGPGERRPSEPPSPGHTGRGAPPPGAIARGISSPARCPQRRRASRVGAGAGGDTGGSWEQHRGYTEGRTKKEQHTDGHTGSARGETRPPAVLFRTAAARAAASGAGAQD
jgi:hypothetical protein